MTRQDAAKISQNIFVKNVGNAAKKTCIIKNQCVKVSLCERANVLKGQRMGKY